MTGKRKEREKKGRVKGKEGRKKERKKTSGIMNLIDIFQFCFV
jgi:hypothetical protein